MRHDTSQRELRLIACCAGAWLACLLPGQARGQCQAIELTVDTTVGGSLVSGDCTLKDLGLSDRDLLVDLYRVTLPTGGALTVSLESSAFDAFLGIVDPNDLAQIAVDDDGGNDINALISGLALGPGSYLVLAHACLDPAFCSTDSGGSYTLSTSFDPVLACTPVDVAPNEVVSGFLASGDCTLPEIGVFNEDLLVDLHRVTLPSGGTLTIGLESPSFDPFLGVFEAEGFSLIATDDDGGNGLDSLVSGLALGPGAYVILAHACLVCPTDSSGPYTLTLVPEPSATLLGIVALGALALARGVRTRLRRAPART